MKRRIVAVMLSVVMGISYTPCYADTGNLNDDLIQSETSELDEESHESDIIEIEIPYEEVHEEECSPEENSEENNPREVEEPIDNFEAEVTEQPVMNAEAGEVIESGSAGDNITYELIVNQNDYYDLVISGSGAMANGYYDSNFEFHGMPWLDYSSSIQTVQIEEGITSIAMSAFKSCGILTSISIPDSVTEINFSAFRDCSNLRSIHIPDGVTQIAGSLFCGCSSLTSVNIPMGVTAIEGNAFKDCSSLAAINIPDSVTSIGMEAFYGCSSLEEVSIPEGVTELSGYTFYKCSRLRSISLPENLTSIGPYVFCNCSSLQSISIPDSVTDIGSEAFGYCSSLTNITIPEGVTELTYCTFYRCSNLTSINLPDSLTKLGTDIFSECRSLKSIHIPESVTEIGYNTFYLCSSLESCNIPNNITAIPTTLFFGCSSLKSINIPSGVTSIGYQAFYGCKSLTSLRIPEGVTTLLGYTFYDCVSLNSVIIPKSITSIGTKAFYGCKNLTIYGYEDSYAQSYAMENEIPFGDAEELDKFYIQTQPMTVTAGVKAKISYTISAKNAVSYQWQYSKNGGNKWINSSVTAGGNTNTINVTVSASNASNIYRCIVTGIDGSQIISETAGVDLLPGVVITLNPKSNAVEVGEFATFTVETENAASYQWQYSKDGANWYKSGAEGNTTDTLIVKGEQKSQGNRYRCVVTGIDGNSKKSYMAAMIVMTEAPRTCTAAVGEIASYSLKAEGIAEYQWQYSKDGGNTWYKSGAEGASTDTVSFKATASNRQMLYRCKLTTSDEATAFTKQVGFAEGLKITECPVSVSASIGEQASFRVTAENVETYQWQYSKDGVKWLNSGLATAKTNSITVTVADANINNVYRCKLTGTDGSVQYTEAVGVNKDNPSC